MSFNSLLTCLPSQIQFTFENYFSQSNRNKGKSLTGQVYTKDLLRIQEFIGRLTASPSHAPAFLAYREKMADQGW